MWAESESVSFTESESTLEVSNERDAMRISMSSGVGALAYQSLWGDAEAWTSGVAFLSPSVPGELGRAFVVSE